MNNKWIRAALPALLIHISVGTVYCWSTFKETIAEAIGMSQLSVGWAFSFAIFFLGMSAAFAGKFVERNIHKSSLVACICFSVGMVGTGLCIKFLTGWAALIGIYVFYGAIMGIGLGVGYLSPVKTLMLWFKDNKGLATGISIMGFGLAKAIATPIMDALQNKYGIVSMFIILGIAYFIIMFVGHLLLKKPDGWVEPTTTEKTSILKTMIRQKEFVGIWIMFFINIHCGLMIISYEKQLLNITFSTALAIATIVSTVPSFTAVANAVGRIGYSTLSDKLKQRNTIYKIILISCIVISCLVICTNALSGSSIILGVIVITYLLVINAGYGGGFSTLPALLSERFGMEKISQIHGLTLSAWAVAGITGNNTSEIILNLNGNYTTVISVATILYAVALFICILVVREKRGYAVE